jgi:hypothetical protein
MRKIAKRVAVGTVAGAVLALLLVLPSSTALAATYGTPCHVVCHLQNHKTLYIQGYLHGKKLIGIDSAYDRYLWVNEDKDVWGLMEVVGETGECWNYADGAVYVDSCIPGDHNEWFAFEDTGRGWLIENYTLGTGEYLSANTNGNALYFDTGFNNTSLWVAIFP